MAACKTLTRRPRSSETAFRLRFRSVSIWAWFCCGVLCWLQSTAAFAQLPPASGAVVGYSTNDSKIPFGYYAPQASTSLGSVQPLPLTGDQLPPHPTAASPESASWDSLGVQPTPPVSGQPQLTQYEMMDPLITGMDGAYLGEYPNGSGPDGYEGDSVEYQSQILPQGLIYRAYLAGEKESRFRSVMNNESNLGWKWDISLGGHVGLYRYGTTGNARPEGFQVDIEGAGLLRLDPEEERDVDSVDFRFGIPVTWGTETYQVKLAYYHLSSHLADEFLIKHPNYPRLNYSRDVFVLGQSYYINPDLRLYGEVGYALYSDISLQWEFQFGIDYSPGNATGWRGAPFAATNAHLRQENNYGGNMVFQVGWAWRRSPSSGLFRIGGQYFNGKSEQFSFYNNFESKVGFGIWYDY